MAGSPYLKLVTVGRRTGLPHVVLLRYVKVGNSYVVLSAGRTSDWYRNALEAGNAKVRVGDFVCPSRARALGGEELRAARTAFESKYGSRMMKEWYSEAVKAIALDPQSVERRGVKGEAEASVDFRTWAASGTPYYPGVAAAFDSASEEYDFTIGRNYINTWIRRRTLDLFLAYARRSDTVLEVGCGTGKEAMEISGHVSAVVATDLSQGMVDLLARKVAARRSLGNITPLRLGASEIALAARLLPGGRTRVAYSFNGALNCEPKLPEFVEQLSSILEPRGLFICSIRNVLCVSEMLSHAAALQFGRATPRKRQPVMISVGGIDIPSTYYSPGAFAERFRDRFVAERTIALPGLIPPAYLNDYYLRTGALRPFIERAELALSGHFPLNRFGDQTLFVFRRRP